MCLSPTNTRSLESALVQLGLDSLSSLDRANASPLLVVKSAKHCNPLVLSTRVLSSRHRYEVAEFTVATKKITFYSVSQIEFPGVRPPSVRSKAR